MIRDAQQHNENATPKDFEIDVLMEALPHYFDEDGNFKMEKFQNMLQEEQVELSRESYELNFLGKSYARLLASLETETVLVPNEEHNNDERNADSENIYITGDNLDALKHLAKSYRGKVKCIYIDPPYNTGKGDFAYNDSFNFTADDLVEQMGLQDSEAERILDLQGKSSHSAWLTFMLPRLTIAKTLLSKDGFLIMSIDDNEQGNARLLLDDVFGETNFIAQVVRKGTGSKQDSTHIATTHEYALMYAKDTRHGRAGKGTVEGRTYSYSDEDGRIFRTQLLRKWGDNDARSDRPNLYYPIPDPDGNDLFPVRADGTEGRWRWERDSMNTALEKDRVHFEKNDDGDWVPYQKIYEDEDSDEKTFGSMILKANDLKEDQLASLYPDPKPFKYPKPVGYLIQLLERAGVEDGDLVLDFFSGSASSAHALLRMNSSDGGKRRMISVQLAEILDKKDAGRKHGFDSIDQLGRDRILRASRMIQETTKATIDYGFKHYTLVTPPQSVIDSLEEFAPDESLFSDDPLEALDFDGTTAQNVLLTTWMIQDGYGLNPEVKKVTLNNYELIISGNTAYAIDGGLTSDDIRVLTQKLEDGEIDITNFVYFHTAIGFERLRELDSALRHLRNRSSVTMTARW